LKFKDNEYYHLSMHTDFL